MRGFPRRSCFPSDAYFIVIVFLIFSAQAAAAETAQANDQDQEVMDNLMSDIQAGFLQRRLPDGGFKQQYSPMVMRKFKRSVEHPAVSGLAVANDDKDGGESLEAAVQSLNSPRITKRHRGGSFSGLADCGGGSDVPHSPSLRRRRSRIPSEEDDKLMNFLVSSGRADDSRERNLSLVGNLVAESQQGGYGSLDRSLMRRSRGRKRPEAVPVAAPEPTPSKEEEPKKAEPMKTRIESWLKDAEEDADKAAKYLDKKKEKKKLADPLASSAKIAKRTDVLKALEVVEDAHAKSEKRKKTPPDISQEEKRRLVRELGRKPSQEKVSLYVRKNSTGEEPNAEKEPTGSLKARQLIESVARKAVDVPQDLLLKPIAEEQPAPTVGQKLAKKYPFNRTTTPNSLREALKETLANNLLEQRSDDLAETIQCIRDDEILDTFNVDSENVETPPAARRDHAYDTASLSSEPRRTGKHHHGSKPLGDREMKLLKKKRAQSDADAEATEDEVGLFDRFSSARKTLGRGSVRRGKSEDSLQEELSSSPDKKSSVSDWRSKLASRFKSSRDQYSVTDAVAGVEDDGPTTYRQTSNEFGGGGAPMTEPPRRRTLHLNGDRAASHSPSAAARSSLRGERARSMAADLRTVRFAFLFL